MKCIVCANTRWKYLFDASDRMFGIPGKFSEYRCSTCSLVRVYPKLSNAKLKKYYPSTNYYSYRGGKKQGTFANLRAYLISHMYAPTVLSRIIGLFISVPAMPSSATPGRVLDIGCGSGETLSLLKSIGWDVYGMDIDPKAIEIAHANSVENARVGTYEQLSRYKNNYFDAIRLYHVIEHLDDPANCMRLAYKKLKPGGELIIGTPNGSSILARIGKQYWYNLDCPRHLYVFNPPTLTSLAKNCGFTQCAVRHMSIGGIVGTLQYFLRDRMRYTRDLISNVWIILFFYPIEKLLDMLGSGDIILFSAKK